MGIDSGKFVTLIDILRTNLTCTICLEIFDAPLTAECVHTFCRSCLEEIIREETNPKNCPLCRKVFNTSLEIEDLTEPPNTAILFISNIKFYRNLLAINIIEDLMVKCNNEGCPEVMRYGSLSAHLILCQFPWCSVCKIKINPAIHNCLEYLGSELEKFKQSTELIIKNGKVWFRCEGIALGTYGTKLDRVYISNTHISAKKIKQISPNSPKLDLEIKWNNLTNLKYCAEADFPTIFLTPNTQDITSIQERFKLRHNDNNNHFILTESNDFSFVIITLKVRPMIYYKLMDFIVRSALALNQNLTINALDRRTSEIMMYKTKLDIIPNVTPLVIPQ